MLTQQSELVDKPAVILLMGPTASGKTSLGVELAKQLNGEIISVDSALVYRGMDIGTAKPNDEERQGIAHHLIDIIDPEESFSAGQFVEQTNRLIQQIAGRGKTPILVGGTMMYFHVLLEGIATLPDADQSIRADIDKQAQSEGWQVVHDRLAQVDPVAAARIHPNDPQRIQRALEVYLVSGRSQTDWISEQADISLSFKPVKLAIAPADRTVLHQKIAERFDLMLKHGFIKEVEVLRQRPLLHENMPSIRAVGYRQAWSHLDGNLDTESFREKSIIATRQLAKRQFTWLRRQKNMLWLETGDPFAMDKLLKYYKDN